MNTPPSSSSPDPFSDEGLESRLLRRAVPAPLDAALLERLRLARPALTPVVGKPSTSPPVSPQANEVRPKTGLVLRPPANVWKRLAVAAAITLCAWAGWRATAPEKDPADSLSQHSPGPAESSETAPDLEFLPSQESRQHLLSVKDLGVVRDSRERPVRLMSTTWLDENTYGDSPADPALRESRLRHEIVPILLPVY